MHAGMRRPALPVALRPPEGLLQRIRWFFLLFSGFFAVTYLPQVTVASPHPVPVRAAAVALLAGLLLWWVRGYRRRHFPLWGLPLEAAAFVAVGVAGPEAFPATGLFYIAVNFRTLYPSWWRALVFTAVAYASFLTAVVVSASLGGPDQVEAFVRASQGVVVLGVITYVTGRAISRGERASAREHALALASTSLAVARDRAEFERATAGAALALLSHPPGATAHVSTDAEPPAAGEHRLVLPLAGPTGPLAHLVVELRRGDVPAEARDALEALTGTAALVLATIGLTEDLRLRAERDGLTGLLNRSELHARLGVLVGRQGHEEPATALWVLVLDLDGFKAVNDTHGHAAGDAVLRAVATRLQQAVRAQDVVGRLGGDEFVVVLQHGTADGDHPAELAERLHAALTAPVDVGAHRWTRVGASIGVAQWCAGDTVDELLGRADRAMYEVKRSAGALR